MALTVPTIDGLLRTRATTHPDDVFLRFANGDVTFAEVDRNCDALAAGLHSLGIVAGSPVPVLMGNRPEFVATWFAATRLGAVATLLNTALRGPALVNAVNLTDAGIAVVDEERVAHLREIAPQLPSLHTIVVLGAAPAGMPWHVVDFDELQETNGSPPAPTHLATDPAMVLFTSGTTGVSKGCVLSHRYGVRQAQLMIEHLELRANDVLYCPFPLFHLDAAVLTVLPALVLGTTAAIAERFSVSGFWEDIRRTGATVFDFMGATLTMLHKQPARPDDRHHAARLAWGVPVPEFAETFEARFGLQLVELYGSTDVGLPIYQPLHEPRVPGSCGRVIDAYEILVADGHDEPVEHGETGQLLVRPLEPSLISDGYFGRPDATIEARRNLWFHTGDLVRQDEGGNVFFVGRVTDSIRRRGENISAFEVEEVVKLHPDVLDAAAYGVPSELTEDDVMVAVTSRAGRVVDPTTLIDFCHERMARHMVPRYVDVVADLPRTPTEKVEKAVLRARGVTPTAWDRERR